MLTIIYSFNKKGYEAEFWQHEIASASNDQFRFIRFNHDHYINVNSYVRAQLLDNLYYEQDPGLLRLYADFEVAIQTLNAAAIIVDNCPLYHPDYLRKLPLYKALRIS